jgi:serine/threonine protein kinase
METNLQSLPSQPYRENSKLPQSISRSVLSALCVLRKLGAIHTDVSPNNVFLSDIDTSSPIVKLGDLGTMTKEGYNKIRIQSLECRAPEVWQGLGCFHASDIWSVGVTLAHWLFGKPIFGASDKIIEGYIDAWCIAKIHKLIGPMPIESCADIEQYKEHFELGEQLALMDMGPDPEHGALVKVGSLREELETISEPSVPEALLDFIYHLLVIDTARRPTANDALQHRYLWSDF